jgi:hypothetical protein
VKALELIAWAPNLLGLGMRFGEELVVVNGVKLFTFRGTPNVDMLGCGPLKTDVFVLECELADPTVFRISPGESSLSSMGGGAGSVILILISPPARTGRTFSSRRSECTDRLSAKRFLVGDPKLSGLDFSRSFALSLAARVADGKYCAKPAVARDIVGQ